MVLIPKPAYPGTYFFLKENTGTGTGKFKFSFLTSSTGTIFLSHRPDFIDTKSADSLTPQNHKWHSASEAHTKTTLPTPGEAKIGAPDANSTPAGRPANPTRTTSDTSTHANTRRASETCAGVRGRAGMGLNARASEAHTKTTLLTTGEAKAGVPDATSTPAGTKFKKMLGKFIDNLGD